MDQDELTDCHLDIDLSPRLNTSYVTYYNSSNLQINAMSGVYLALLVRGTLEANQAPQTYVSQ